MPEDSVAVAWEREAYRQGYREGYRDAGGPVPTGVAAILATLDAILEELKRIQRDLEFIRMRT